MLSVSGTLRDASETSSPPMHPWAEIELVSDAALCDELPCNVCICVVIGN